MSVAFCTIATTSHLPHARVLHASLQAQDAAAALHVLVTDANELPANERHLHFHATTLLDAEPLAAEITAKYASEPDHLRWALKPLLLLALLRSHEKLVYVDVDVFFVNGYAFLSEALDRHRVLLTPHWAPFVPHRHTADFELNFRIGLYNAGFVGVNRSATNTLRWWAELCLFRMEKNPDAGYFVDQRYLDLLPVVDAEAGILRHPGCNVAGWNIHQNRRSLRNGEVVINGEFPVVFVHFNQSTFDQLMQGNDPLLEPLLQRYKQAFAALGYSFDSLKAGVQLPQSPVLRLKRKARIRTRLKQLLFTLYQKL